MPNSISSVQKKPVLTARAIHVTGYSGKKTSANSDTQECI